jgi:hypothetical protein
MQEKTDKTIWATFGKHKVLPLHFGGHSLLCRQCAQGDRFGDTLDRAMNGVVLPPQYADRTNWLEVIGKGPNVGKPCTIKHMHKFKRARHLTDQAQVGDLVMCPNTAEGCDGIRVSPFAHYIYFIEESVPLAMIHNN